MQSNTNKKVVTTELLNGQDPLEPPAHVVVKTAMINMKDKSQENKVGNESEVNAATSANKFVITPDYIQQSMFFNRSI